MPYMSHLDKKKFYENTLIPESENGCMIWKGLKHKKYGLMECNGRQQNAQNVSFRMHYARGIAPYVVRRKCKNDLCVRPDHLYLGKKIVNPRFHK